MRSPSSPGPGAARLAQVAVHGIDEELLGMCGARNPAGQQALPLGGYPHAS